MKRSLTVRLVMLGTVASAITACDREPEQVQLQQQTYASLTDCEDDWGRNNDICQPENARGGSGTGSSSGGSGSTTVTRYVGPRYYWDRSAGYPVVVDNAGHGRPLPESKITAKGSDRARATNSSSVSRSGVSGFKRGGFGASAHAMSAGG